MVNRKAAAFVLTVQSLTRCWKGEYG